MQYYWRIGEKTYLLSVNCLLRHLYEKNEHTVNKKIDRSELKKGGLCIQLNKNSNHNSKMIDRVKK